MKENNTIISGIYIKEIASWRLWILGLDKNIIYLEKRKLIELFQIKSKKALNLFLCRNKDFLEKRIINNKNVYLINLFLIIPYLIKTKK
jgi:hypothetical protein